LLSFLSRFAGVPLRVLCEGGEPAGESRAN
jgi:hypothetical protein